MKYRSLGRTGIQVSELGLGGLFISAGSRDEGIRVVRRALELGITLFDTAPSYNLKNGSQDILGEALDGVNQPHVVSTKVGPNPVIKDFNYSYDHCMQLFEHDLKELRRDRVDILHIHDPDRYGDRSNPGNYHAVFGRGMALSALRKLKEQGVIRAIGLGSLWMDFQAHCIDTGEFDVVLTFNRYGLLWRDAQFQTFPFCRRRNVGVLQGTPFHQGVLVRPRPDWIENPPDWMTPTEHDRYRRLLTVAETAGLPLPELALRFILANTTVSATIPGAQTVEQLEANVAFAEKGPLPADLQAEIESLGILHEDPRRYY